MTAQAVTIGVLLAAIALLLGLHARRIVRAERGQRPGQPPGEGEFLSQITYSSGLSGGNTATIRAPRDPQAWARQFVPRDRRKKDET